MTSILYVFRHFISLPFYCLMFRFTLLLSFHPFMSMPGDGGGEDGPLTCNVGLFNHNDHTCSCPSLSWYMGYECNISYRNHVMAAYLPTTLVFSLFYIYALVSHSFITYYIQPSFALYCSLPSIHWFDGRTMASCCCLLLLLMGVSG
jgi:uncharacterized membrane protein (DUF485 family)